MTMERSQITPLHLAPDIYQVLSKLEIGQPVPAHIYIADYQDGSIPVWIVRECEEGCGGLIVLTVCDEDNGKQETLFDRAYCVARDIFTLPTKTLAGPLYGYYPGCVHARDMLADIRQHARQIVDRRHEAESQVPA